MSFRYWLEPDGLSIRTCQTCKASQAKSPKDGEWINYLTLEWFMNHCDYYQKHLKDMPECQDCKDE